MVEAPRLTANKQESKISLGLSKTLAENKRSDKYLQVFEESKNK